MYCVVQIKINKINKYKNTLSQNIPLDEVSMNYGVPLVLVLHSKVVGDVVGRHFSVHDANTEVHGLSLSQELKPITISS